MLPQNVTGRDSRSQHCYKFAVIDLAAAISICLVKKLRTHHADKRRDTDTVWVH